MDGDFKACTNCGKLQPICDFYADGRCPDGLRGRCKGCFLAQCAKRRAENTERVREIGRVCAAKRRVTHPGLAAEWRKANPEKARESRREWERKNPEKMRAKWRRQREKKTQEQRAEIGRRQYQRNKGDVAWRLKTSICSRLNRAIRTGKYGRRTEGLLGYSVKDLMAHLERQFLRGMSWGNYGEWHIDHIIPLSSFSIESYESPDFVRAWALANLRPLWAADNVRKSAQIQHLC